MSAQFEDAIELIIRPKRFLYYGKKQKNEITFAIQNQRNLTITGIYCPAIEPLPRKACVIALHGNGGNYDMMVYLNKYFSNNRVAFCTFDFSGCGRSQGDYISLGYYEKDDVISVMDFLRERYQIEDFGLYGYSMGAATALRVLAERPEIKGAVLDSPYSSILGFLGKFMYPPKSQSKKEFFEEIRKEVQERAHFDIHDNVIDIADKIHQPVYFIHGENDKLVPPVMSELLLEKCSSEQKFRITFDGDHNSFRPFSIESIAINFLLDQFGAPHVS